MEFIKNDLIDAVMLRTYDSFRLTLDTTDFVTEKDNKKISKVISKNMMKKFKQVNIYYLLLIEEMGVNLSFFQKLKVFFSGLRPVYNVTKEDVFKYVQLFNKELQVKESEELAEKK